MENLWELNLPQNKCCPVGYSFSAKHQCERHLSNGSYEIGEKVPQTLKTPEFRCPEGYMTSYSFAPDNATSICSDLLQNGTEVFTSCYQLENRTKSNGDGIRMWGTQTYMSTNIAHVILCIIIVTIYYFVPELSRSLYNRAILRHYISLMCLGIMLSTLGYFDICNCPINSTILSCLWLALQYFTLSTVLWLNVIGYDMALVITRFTWLKSTQEDDKKLLIYSIFSWTCALIPVLFAATFEFAPGLPDDFVFKPMYTAYQGKRRWIVNYYFFFLPSLTLLFNNVLFVYTTVKVIGINRSTEIATNSQSTTVKKNYVVFLKLYLLMGAPWFFGCLLAFIYNELIVLKCCRVLQPAMWIVFLMTDQKLRKAIVEKMCLMPRLED